MIAIVTCACGFSESKARNFLKSVGYKDWLSIPVHKGKEKSRSVLNQLPPAPEKEMLDSFLKNASKWVVIIGYTDTEVKWSDIAHNAPKSRIEADFIVKSFSES